MSTSIAAPPKKDRKVRATFTLDEDLEAGLKEVAAEERRSASAHVAWLIEQDLKRRRQASAPATD